MIQAQGSPVLPRANGTRMKCGNFGFVVGDSPSRYIGNCIRIMSVISFQHRTKEGGAGLVPHLVWYFFKMFLISYGCAHIAMRIMFGIWPHLVAVVRQKQNLDSLGGFDIAFALLLSPIIESAMLLYVTSIMVQIVKNKTMACILGALPLALLHAAIDWRVAVVALIPFALQGVVYINIRKYIDLLSTLLFIAGIHSCMNVVSIAINFYRFST